MEGYAVFVVLLVLYCTMVTGTTAQCNCFHVNATDVTLAEVVSRSPLYTQSASLRSLSGGIDSVCLHLTNTCTPDNVLTQQHNTFSDGSTQSRGSIQSTNSTGSFLVTGPARTYYDIVLGSPCDGTYTIYRCVITGTCITDETLVDVIVVSSRLRDFDHCIEEGKLIGQAAIPGIEFYDMPRKTEEPCLCNV